MRNVLPPTGSPLACTRVTRWIISQNQRGEVRRTFKLLDIDRQEAALGDHSRMDQSAARFAKQHGAKDKRPAYEAEQEVVRAKTERLRALRLARDTAEHATAAATPRSKAPRKKKPSASLSEWLGEQQKSGRRS